MVRLIIRIKQIYDKFAADEMTVYAAQASFFTIIAAFPFIMLLLTVVQIVPSVSQGELMEFILALVPVGYKSVAFRVISDLSLKSPATMISVTAVTALWSSSRGMMSIAKGLNRVQGKVGEALVHCEAADLRRIHDCVHSGVRVVPGPSGVRHHDSEFRAAPVPADRPGDPAHHKPAHAAGAGVFYVRVRRDLHLCAGPEAFVKVPAPGRHVHHRGLDFVLNGVFPDILSCLAEATFPICTGA